MFKAIRPGWRLRRGQGKRRAKPAWNLGMKESYEEDLANHSGLEPYAGDGNIAGVIANKFF